MQKLQKIFFLIIVFINSLLAKNIIRHYNFVNFDQSEAYLRITFPDDSCYLDYSQYLQPAVSGEENYRNIVKALYNEYKDKFQSVYSIFENSLRNTNERYVLNTIIAFIQSLEYRVPPKNINGMRTLGLLPPNLSLIDQYGDCDTKSLLFCCIARYNYDVIYLVGSKHAFVGVAGKPENNQEYVSINGKRYILCELTSHWPLGKIPITSKNDINQGEYYYIYLEKTQ